MYFVVRGRLKVIAAHAGRPDHLLETIGRGGHFGELALLGEGIRTATVTATADTDLLELDEDRFNRALAAVPGFAANLSRSLIGRLRAENARRSKRHRPAVVAIVDAVRPRSGVAAALAQALVERGERLDVLTDRTERLAPAGTVEYMVEPIPRADSPAEVVKTTWARLHQVIEHHHRVLLDVDATRVAEEWLELLNACEEILWVVDPRSSELGRNTLARVLERMPNLASRIHVTWLMADARDRSPAMLVENPLAEPQFKAIFDEGSAPSWAARQSITRIVRHLRGNRLGLALGGGGARGLAHLGVIRAFEREGIGFDLVAGASSGALMGIAYCAGWTPDEALREFKQALTPRRLVRALPGGARWHMWSMFRLGAWDGMLRRYLPDVDLQQLPIPLSTVTVDLVSGAQVVRDRGDAVRAVLESINLPFISRPILHEGMALVDGGVLNNLPGDALTARGADMVVAVDVSRQLPGFPAKGSRGRRARRAGLIETLLRVNDVQSRAMLAMRADAIDLTIAPDCSRFDFADFTRADELGDLGDVAAQEVLPKFKELLAERDRALTAATA